MRLAASLLFLALVGVLACGTEGNESAESLATLPRAAPPSPQALPTLGLPQPASSLAVQSPAVEDSAFAELPESQDLAGDVGFLDDLLICYQSVFITGKPGCYGKLIERAGPDQVLLGIRALIASGEVDSGIDTHVLAHQIGRQTASVFGLRGEAFLRCSTEFNYGCQHGFFENALANSPDATQAAFRVCADLVESSSRKTAFYCYHGVGHGVMMASAYDLDLALETCDSLGDFMASDGCWQGVFMENVNAVMRGEAREGVFSDAEPLAPCSRVADRHKWECYINHAGRLVTLFEMSIEDASRACLEASARFVSPCIQSLGLMVSNPAWQRTLAGAEDDSQTVQIALELCGLFPDEHESGCIVGAVDNIMNFEGVVLDVALDFCGAADGTFRDNCYRRIGVGLSVQVIDLERRLELCKQVDPEYAEACLEGAGVEIVDGRATARGP